MTRKEFKAYLEEIHERWHGNTFIMWTHILKEGKLGSEEEFNERYWASSVSINESKETFVTGLLKQYYPTKLDKALK